MKQLIIKIGGDMLKDMKEVWDDPSKGKPGTHTVYVKNMDELYEVLSPKRIELLNYVLDQPKEEKNISEIAKKLKRKQEAVSRDANLLEKHSLITKTKKKQKVYLKPLQVTANRITN
ncbi:MAG: hypothetical protein ABH821_03765 [archaeon]